MDDVARGILAGAAFVYVLAGLLQGTVNLLGAEALMGTNAPNRLYRWTSLVLSWPWQSLQSINMLGNSRPQENRELLQSIISPAHDVQMPVPTTIDFENTVCADFIVGECAFCKKPMTSREAKLIEVREHPEIENLLVGEIAASKMYHEDCYVYQFVSTIVETRA